MKKLEVFQDSKLIWAVEVPARLIEFMVQGLIAQGFMVKVS